MQSSAAHSARLAPRGAGSRPPASPAQQQSQAQRPQRRRRLDACRAGGDKDLLQLDDELKTGKEASGSAGKGFGAPPPQPKAAKKAGAGGGAGAERERPFKIDLPSREQQSPADKFEENVVRILALLFLVFLAEGLALALAGFLSEEADSFITAYVYPAFSPTLGVFLLISVIYGLVKSRQGGSA